MNGPIQNKAKEALLTAADARHLLDYNPFTGALVWRNPLSNYAKRGDAFGSLRTDGRRHGLIRGLRYLDYRLAWLCHFGKWPEKSIDHIDGNPGNNRIRNLRDVSHRENLQNQKSNSANTSGASGVRWDRARKKWRAEIKSNGKNIHLGRFPDFDEAVAARKQAERDYGFHPNHGRAL